MYKAGLGRDVSLAYEEALEKTRQALEAEGFGILTTIDVKATMKQKLDMDHPPFMILGACNPPLAHRALTAAPEIGVMLPCNVVVRELEPGKSRVETINAELMGQMFPGAEVASVAREVGTKLARVLDAIAG
jgi:uncharacterized protein (DUF302 family)